MSLAIAAAVACSSDDSGDGAVQAGAPAVAGKSGSPGAAGTGSSGAPGASGGGVMGIGGGASTAGKNSAGDGAGVGGKGTAGTSGSSGSGGASASGGTPGAGAPGASNGGGGGVLGSSGSSGSGGSAGGAGTGMSGGVAPVLSGGVRWVGRVDVSNAMAQKFSWSATGFVATVSGETIAVKLRSEGGNDAVFFQPVIDGQAKARFSVSQADGDKTVTLGSALAAGDHVVELYRETEGKPGYPSSTFLGFASGTLKAPPAYNGRLIEVVGDSISAGYGNLGMEQHPSGGADPSGGCHFTTDTESAYLTYGAVAARAVNADASILAASGWGIYSDNGGNTSNVLPKVYDQTVGGQATPAWAFSSKPQAVVINLGTNDFSANQDLDKASFSTAYSAFLTTVRGKYPDALILCAIGPLLYGNGLTNARTYINAIVEDLRGKGDTKVQVLDFGQQDASKGTGCDWHPNVAENARMAEMLAQKLRTTLGW